eukprot:2674852-Ditylum_brightwellii.AAC.1
MASNFGTKVKCKVTFALPELNPTTHIVHSMHVASTLGRYNMIISRNVLHELCIGLDFKENNTNWGDYQASMEPADVTLAEHILYVEADKILASEMAKIQDTKY